MSRRTIIMGGVIVGTYVGSYIPVLWGDSVLSFMSIVFSGVGGILGIWVTFVLTRGM